MNINEFKTSKYLSQDDVGPGILLTIRGIKKENLARDGEQPKIRGVLYFGELEKGLVMGSTNLELAAHALGSEETDEWIGKKIVLYKEPTISFGGKLVGGIRVRAARLAKAAPVTKPPPGPWPTGPRRPDPDPDEPIEEGDPEVPF